MADEQEIPSASSVVDTTMNMHNTMMSAINTLTKETAGRAIFVLSHLRQIIQFQSEELTVFRQLEGYVRNGQLTEEEFTKTFNALDALRQDQSRRAKESFEAKKIPPSEGS